MPKMITVSQLSLLFTYSAVTTLSTVTIKGPLTWSLVVRTM